MSLCTLSKINGVAVMLTGVFVPTTYLCICLTLVNSETKLCLSVCLNTVSLALFVSFLISLTFSSSERHEIKNIAYIFYTFVAKEYFCVQNARSQINFFSNVSIKPPFVKI